MTSAESTLTNQGIPEATLKAWSELLTQVRADETLKQRLVNTPAEVLQEHGIEVPAGMEIRVIENTDKVSYLTLPARTSQGELTSEELTKVSGGNPLVMFVLGAASSLLGSTEATGQTKVTADVIKLAQGYGKGKKPQ